MKEDELFDFSDIEAQGSIEMSEPKKEEPKEHPSARFLRITSKAAFRTAFKPQRALSYLFGDSQGVRTFFSVATSVWLLPIAATGAVLEACAEKIDGISNDEVVYK